MFTTILATGGSYLILALVALLAVLAIGKIRKTKQQGGCIGCSGCQDGRCHRSPPQDQEDH